jgi:hypothetical protein
MQNDSRLTDGANDRASIRADADRGPPPALPLDPTAHGRRWRTGIGAARNDASPPQRRATSQEHRRCEARPDRTRSGMLLLHRGYVRGTGAPRRVLLPQLQGGSRVLGQASRVENLTPRLSPRNQFDIAIVQISCTTVNLGLPGDFRILVVRAVEAFDQASDQRVASLRRKSQRLL